MYSSQREPASWLAGKKQVALWITCCNVKDKLLSAYAPSSGTVGLVPWHR